MKISFILMIVLSATFISCNDTTVKKNEAPDAQVEDRGPAPLDDISTSKNIQVLLCQDWENKEDAEDAAASGSGGDLEMPYRGFSFFKDGSFTENPRDKIRFGKWKLNDAEKMIDLEYTAGSKGHQKIGAIGPKQLILLNMADKKKMEYKSDALVEIEPTNDPFHPTNNRWRVKPSKPETDSAIKVRVKQSVTFYAKFLKDNAARGGNIISFVGLPGCFKWYSGAITVVNKSKIEDKWINCFYNKEQAIKGQQLLENVITKKYKWNKKETNWVKQSADVMLQIYDTLR